MFDYLHTVQIAKHKDYSKLYYDYVSDKRYEALWNLFNVKRRRISEEFISYRLINHWENEGLISNLRNEEGGGWRKYSYMDIIWLLIMKELRNFGYGLTEIKNVKNTLITGLNKCEYGELEFYAALCLTRRVPINVLAFSNNTAEVGTYYEIIDTFKNKGLLNHISINLNSILMVLFPSEDLTPRFNDFIEFTNKEVQILESIRMENIDSLAIEYLNGEPDRIKISKSESPDIKVANLIIKDAYQSITTEIHNGKVKVHKRLIKKKLKD